MKRFIAYAACVLGPIVSVGAFAQSTELKLLNTFDGRFPGTPLVVEKYIEAVKAASKGKLSFRSSGPEVVPAPEQFQPVKRGAFDILFTVQPWHVNVASVSLGLYTLDPDPEGWRKNGVFDYVDKDYARHNLKLLAAVPGQAPGTGSFHVLLKEDVKPGQDFSGRKVRANPFYKAFTDSLNASVVTLQGGEIYGALQRGTVDGVIWPVVGAMDFKWYEVSKFMVAPRFGYSYYLLLINLDKFNKLDPADRQVLMDEARKIEPAGMAAMTARTQQELRDLAGKGMKEISLDQAQYDKAIAAFQQGLWTLAFNSKASGGEAKQFHEFLKGKGLVK